MNRTRRALVALGCLVAVAPARAQPASPGDDDWREIRRVIAAQRAALVAGDGAAAYAHASPGIRRQFGDPSTFLAMVRASYADLVEATDASFAEGAVIDGHVIQPLRLVLPGGTVKVALYTMERQRDGGWRISGCAIAPSTLRSA